MPNEQEKVVADQLMQGAVLTLQAKTSVRRYRCTAVKISNLTGSRCAYGPQEMIVATSRNAARIAFIKKNGAEMQDDVIGSWDVGVFLENDGLMSD